MMTEQDLSAKNYTENRPWGNFTVLYEGDTYKVKRISVNPGHRLSLQFHKHRDEQWVIVKGKPIVTCGKSVKECLPGENVDIKRGVVHRVQNSGSDQVVFIEVQNGDYLGEDDIVRLEDDYSR